MQTEVHFLSTAFNCTVPKDYFINKCCFGDDVCRWLIQQLRTQDIQTSAEPGQEDFGWHFTFRAGELEHRFFLGFQPNDPATGDQWLGWVERQRGLFGSLAHGRRHGIRSEAIQIIDAALKSSPDIRSVTWQ